MSVQTAALRLATGQVVRYGKHGFTVPDGVQDVFDAAWAAAVVAALPVQTRPDSLLPILEAGARLGLWTIVKPVRREYPDDRDY